MSVVWNRYILHYLAQARSHPDDWSWFDREWPQIQRAWRYLATVDPTDNYYEQALAIYTLHSERMQAVKPLAVWEMYMLRWGKPNKQWLAMNNSLLSRTKCRIEPPKRARVGI